MAARQVRLPAHPQLAGAIGAALYALEENGRLAVAGPDAERNEQKKGRTHG